MQVSFETKKEMNIKLWVDDYRDAPDDSWTVARTTEDAVRLISNNFCSEISLDHDIENRPETFQPVAYCIGWMYTAFHKHETMKGVWKPKIHIHSMNPVGAKEIQNILEKFKLVATASPPSKELEDFNKRHGLET